MKDLWMEITYPIGDRKYEINSNIKKELWSDQLADFIHSQVGAGEDKRKAKKRKVYHIKIEVDLSDDSITITSDTGNNGLTVGIMMDVLGRMGD